MQGQETASLFPLPAFSQAGPFPPVETFEASRYFHLLCLFVLGSEGSVSLGLLQNDNPEFRVWLRRPCLCHFCLMFGVVIWDGRSASVPLQSPRGEICLTRKRLRRSLQTPEKKLGLLLHIQFKKEKEKEGKLEKMSLPNSALRKQVLQENLPFSLAP